MAANDPPSNDRQPLAIVVLLNCVLVGLGTLYVTTASALVTLSAAVAVVALMAMYLHIPGSLRQVETKGESVNETYDELFVSWFPTLVGYLIKAGYERSQAEDVAEDTMTDLAIHWKSIESPRAWTLIVARRKASKLASQSKRETLEAEPDRSALDWSGSVDTKLTVEAVLSQLPPKQREVLLLSMTGLKPAAIAEMLNAKPNQVRANLHEARKRVREHLARGQEGN